VTIAILDTGVDPTTTDLEGAFVPGYDFVNNDTDPRRRAAESPTGVDDQALGDTSVRPRSRPDKGREAHLAWSLLNAEARTLRGPGFREPAPSACG
jgi:subtilisin family serine protease